MKYSYVNTHIEIGCKLANMGNEFRDWVREFRRVKGWTQADLADKLKVSQTTVSQWEAGRNKPVLASLQGLAHISGRPLAEFLPFLEDSGVEATQALDPLLLDFVQTLSGQPDSVKAAVVAMAKAMVESFDRGQSGLPTDAGGSAARANEK